MGFEKFTAAGHPWHLMYQITNFKWSTNYLGIFASSILYKIHPYTLNESLSAIIGLPKKIGVASQANVAMASKINTFEDDSWVIEFQIRGSIFNTYLVFTDHSCIFSNNEKWPLVWISYNFFTIWWFTIFKMCQKVHLFQT